MPEIKERPILFSAPMVRAILEGRKTVTRRAVNPQPVLTDGTGFLWKGHLFGSGSDSRETSRNFSRHCCPYGKSGERLWVRETWARAGNGDPGYLTYRATYPACLPPGLENVPPASYIRWNPSIHMFRRDSRILLEITDVRVERLQDISNEQAEAEGVDFLRAAPDLDETLTAAQLFDCLWTSIKGAESWDANPWVWVVEFKRVTP
ncbi:ASCH domain-containing protein [Pseudomonas sp. IT-P100]|uniref:hypothetical protein n=1 Tax=Pseudomonas sp. IT-P100 TaxID=3026452 RepID=UPI0039E05100